MKIGSHVSMKAPNFVLGSVEEALSYQANACMIYTGAPQNTRRQPLEKMKIDEAKALMDEHQIPMEQMIVHAPYIINLANTLKADTYELAVEFLQKEIERVRAIGAKYLVLHPGSHVKAGEDVGLDQIVKGLDEALSGNEDVYIALETMSGKGSELGYTFEQLKYIIDHCKHQKMLRVCMDTCHMHDAGYDVADFDALLDHFDDVVGLERLVCIHLNDTKNEKGAKKDRHANLGHGKLGFDTLCKIANHPRVDHVVKILETPWIDGNAPYKEEIEMLQTKTFVNIIE
ncbi:MULTISPECIES: deoxyribonuclease IV [unclassified Breznakia]|uniref:deoxyribonuclease IV n=1 Tax=unclassified Breznakia TaxID=2623764 RepID=UPI002477154D|nr:MULTISPECIES: deoxyribonuclease IV [unclassified Breznakia]MDH6367686.1 deoxyribonuclease-4 [Breznakia sp. PH1-1]MDH6404774.1 deoxyribonuclease-4 [Breznakia sp. PF1-11]MDH6412519.1 deoxyribonuclease-4 [Breznakia sp. PFB1-11]MDH6414879.1 deoxyribonuclease-4 [Breznakia sp. PFB1-14]MDH6417190.1 deoxyribonuclease-4 [Breznakia sp. PFB1-4]